MFLIHRFSPETTVIEQNMQGTQSCQKKHSADTKFRPTYTNLSFSGQEAIDYHLSCCLIINDGGAVPYNRTLFCTMHRDGNFQTVPYIRPLVPISERLRQNELMSTNDHVSILISWL